MTWKELFQALKEKRKLEGEGDDTKPWIDLLLLLDSEKSFFSLKKETGRKISVEKEKSSKKVLDYFLEKTWERSILESRPSKV